MLNFGSSTKYLSITYPSRILLSPTLKVRYAVSKQSVCCLRAVGRCCEPLAVDFSAVFTIPTRKLMEYRWFSFAGIVVYIEWNFD